MNSSLCPLYDATHPDKKPDGTVKGRPDMIANYEPLTARYILESGYESDLLEAKALVLYAALRNVHTVSDFEAKLIREEWQQDRDNFKLLRNGKL